MPSKLSVYHSVSSFPVHPLRAHFLFWLASWNTSDSICHKTMLLVAIYGRGDGEICGSVLCVPGASHLGTHLLDCSSHFLCLIIPGQASPWTLSQAFPSLKVTPPFSGWWIDLPKWFTLLLCLNYHLLKKLGHDVQCFPYPCVS